MRIRGVFHERQGNTLEAGCWNDDAFTLTQAGQVEARVPERQSLVTMQAPVTKGNERNGTLSELNGERNRSKEIRWRTAAAVSSRENMR